MSAASARRSPPPESGGVRSRAEFAAFLGVLRSDLEERPEGWENVSLEALLEAFAAVALDAPGGAANGGCADVETPSWSLFARLVATATVYEESAAAARTGAIVRPVGRIPCRGGGEPVFPPPVGRPRTNGPGRAPLLGTTGAGSRPPS
ncbi:DUF7660 family protein [Alienimonas californiensis]|uniref:DUF7660 domain-containing protein n=1 Tax=Alienimonas californiensis TaxID=2527989 RepID=A0A517PF55_9PLAN|nr:hypothetical protein [Alienimonas californiensis]QDT18017.1 hypothetical protein CA12_41550 [Alienimonas californiensis]